MNENIPSWALWVPLLSALGGSLVTGLIAIWMNRQNRFSEEKKHLRQLLFNTAIENWKTRVDMIKETGGTVMPLDSFIIHMVKLSEIFNENITKDNIPSKMKEIREITDAMQDVYKEIKEKDSHSKCP